MEPLDFTAIKKELIAKFGNLIRDVDVLSYAMYPKVFQDYTYFTERFGPVSKLNTKLFFDGPSVGELVTVELEKGKTLHIKVLAIGDLLPSGEREVFFEMNGQLRSLYIKDSCATQVFTYFR